MPSESLPWRHSLWVAGLVALVWLACFRFPMVWVATGIGESGRPFMDLHGILAACDASRAGVDPFLPNDFDPYHRPHVYSTWWLALGRLGLGRSDTLWLGSALVAAVLLMAVIVVRPQTRHEGVALFLFLASPAVLLAVNRANNDLVVFLLVGCGLLCFRRENLAWQSGGVVLFAVSAVLKYSPLVTLVVLLDLRTRRALAAGLGAAVVVLALGWPGLVPGLQSAARFNPAPDGLFAFGAPVFLRNLGIPSTLGWLVPGLLLLGWVALQAWRKKGGAEPASSEIDRQAQREFVCGAALVVGLFFLGSSFAYKLIFALWLLPWLGRQAGAGGQESRWARITWCLLLAAVWFEGGMAVVLNVVVGPWSLPTAQAMLKATLFLSQVATWALVACLLRYLFGYAVRRGHALWASG
ncbi:MAG TPA: glycosyltransferase 87 family protein [Lacunisphaera sp.]|nr:glycosyltransferase 87 family protein [Lacunisphaera sp.]